jgi:hypothetical protein
LRQGISNFRLALTAEHRSASLLFYYAMLNFAKAELLHVAPAAVDGFAHHGLRFNGTRARSIAGDTLSVTDGVFPLLYETRTGRPIRVGERLRVKSLLTRIPEIGEQGLLVGLSPVWETTGVLHLLAADDSQAWAVLAVERLGQMSEDSESGRYFRRVFRQIDPPWDWKARFGISPRWSASAFFESIASFPFAPNDDAARLAALNRASANTWMVRDLLGMSTMATFDAWVTPSLYRTRMVPMPPSIARYAVSFYASSLVRYRPSMFDAQEAPEQAYLFDCLARECAVPMLLDTLAALTGVDYHFVGSSAFRF